VDFLTISNILEKSGELELVGGPAFLAELINTVQSFNVEAYARIVKEKSQRRALIRQANELATIAYDETRPISEAVGRVLDGIVNQTYDNEGESRHISHGLRDLAEFVEMRMANPKEIWGIPTGFRDLDSFTGGQHGGEDTYIAGEPGVGKTKLAMQIAVNAALPENGSHPVVIYSFEMRELEIIKRVVSGRGHITTMAMNTGRIDDKTLTEYMMDIEYLERLPIYTCDKPKTPPQLRADIRKRQLHDGVELFVLDYLLLMQGYEDMDETPRSTLLSRAVKNITQDLGVAGITVSSVLKDQIASTAVPTNKGMRGSAQVIHDADNIAFLTQGMTPETANLAYLTFTKMRNVNRPKRNATIELEIDNQYPIFHDSRGGEVTTVNLDNLF
jgi:replicative DNA helicase